jgi:hypothetical protein
MGLPAHPGGRSTVQTWERSIELRHMDPGMTVRDAVGEKIGTVAHLHQRVGAGGPALDAVAGGPALDAVASTVLEVRTGFLGRGERLYVPFGAVGGLTQAGLVLTATRQAIADEHPEWRTRPADLPDERVPADRGRSHARPDDWYRLLK